LIVTICVDVKAVQGCDRVIDMESVGIGYFKIYLMRKIRDYLVNSLYLFLPFLVFKIVILHLVQNLKNAVKHNLVNLTQKLLSSAQV